MEIILHVFDIETGKELPYKDAFTPNTRVFSFNTDDILDDKQFGDTDVTKATRMGKTREQDFKDRIVELKTRAKIEQPCTKDYCHLCKHCYNAVCDGIGRKADKLP